MIDQYRNKILIGHVLERLSQLPDNSVDMMITSPPYWGLRDYETEHMIWDENSNVCTDHQWKEDGKQETKLGSGGITHEINAKVRRPKSSPTFHCTYSTSLPFNAPGRVTCPAWMGSLGLEPTPQLFVSHLVQIFLEVKRVLKSTGTMWINMGDTYAGSGGKGNQYTKNIPDYRQPTTSKALHKSLIGIPDRLKIALIDAGLLCRNEIIWYKPNAMPQSAKDRFTNDTEKLYLFSFQKRYYFEQQFEPHTDASVEDLLRRKTMTYYKEEGSESKYVTNETGLDGDKRGRTRDQFYGDLSKGRNKRTTWKYEDVEEEASYRQGMHKDRGSGIVVKRNLPDKEEFVTWLRDEFTNVNGIKHVSRDTGINESTIEHWFRMDDSGHSFPSVEDWNKMLNIYDMSNQWLQLVETWEESDAIRPYSVQERTKDIVEYRELPPHDELRAYLSAARKRSKYTIETIEEIYGTQAPHHWFEKDGSYPSAEDWIKLKSMLVLDNTYDDDMLTIFSKSSEKTSSACGRNKRTTWKDGENVKPAYVMEVPTRAMAEAHFAVFPEQLVETPIIAGCPTAICSECNRPKIIEYETDKINTRPGKDTLKGKSGTDKNPNLSLHSSDLSKYRQQIVRSNFKYITQCECGAEFKPGIVMDIFMGSGTVAVVAKRLERDYIGIELNREYAEIADARIRAGGTKANIPKGYTQTDVTKGL